MPDKKLTDTEIKKALEESISFDEPYESNFTLIRIEYIKNALDLINRLQAENERLKEEIELFHSDHTYKIVKAKAKAEAYKECIEKVEELLNPDSSFDFRKQLDNLLKEMGVDTDV